MKESLIQTAIEQYLKILENQKKIVYIKNNTGAYSVSATSKHKRRFVRFGRAGSPDFFIFLPSGKCLHLEVKNEKGKQNDNQTEYQAMIEKLGHRYFIVRSVDEAEKQLTSLL